MCALTALRLEIRVTVTFCFLVSVISCANAECGHILSLLPATTLRSTKPHSQGRTSPIFPSIYGFGHQHFTLRRNSNVLHVKLSRDLHDNYLDVHGAHHHNPLTFLSQVPSLWHPFIHWNQSPLARKVLLMLLMHRKGLHRSHQSVK